MANTTWNPSDANAAFSGGFSNGNLTATVPGSISDWAGVRGTASRGTGSGKLVFEITSSSFSSGDGFIFGVSNSTWNLSGVYLGADINGCGFQIEVGNVYFNGGAPVANASCFYNASTFPTSMWAGDFVSGKAWFYGPSNGQWNGAAIGSQNPATGTGGINGVAGNGVYPSFVCLVGGGQNIITLNTTGPFVNPVPSGFSPWDQTSSTNAAAFMMGF